MKEATGIQNLLEPLIVGMDYELVGIEYMPGRTNGLLRIYIDSDKGITLHDCERVSHQVSGVLDVEDPIKGSFRLEVSSPGLDRPLFKKDHFERYAGHVVKLELSKIYNTRRRFTGQLIGVDNNDVILIENNERVIIPFDLITKARIVPQGL